MHHHTRAQGYDEDRRCWNWKAPKLNGEPWALQASALGYATRCAPCEVARSRDVTCNVSSAASDCCGGAQARPDRMELPQQGELELEFCQAVPATIAYRSHHLPARQRRRRCLGTVPAACACAVARYSNRSPSSSVSCMAEVLGTRQCRRPTAHFLASRVLLLPRTLGVGSAAFCFSIRDLLLYA